MIKSKTEFSQTIEQLAVEKNLSLMDAIIHYCDKNNIEVETVATKLSKNLKEKIAFEAESLNLLKTDKERLPI